MTNVGAMPDGDSGVLTGRLAGFPGADLVAQGLADLSMDKQTEAAILLEVAAPRLANIGIRVTPIRANTGSGESPEHRLWGIVSAKPGAHSYYNALLARMVSFARAAEHAAPR